MVRQPSYYVLILANLIPVAGVLLFDWSVPSILVLYWTESVAIGVINVLRMICCRADKILPVLPQLAGNALPEEVNAAMAEGMPQVSGKGLKFFLVPFFRLGLDLRAPLSRCSTYGSLRSGLPLSQFFAATCTHFSQTILATVNTSERSCLY